MKLFQCQCCGQVLHFENTRCLGCGNALGYLPERDAMVAVAPDGPVWNEIASDTPAQWRFCRNWELSACNWLVSADGMDEFCPACVHNRTVPDLSDPENLEYWQKIETAKRRLFYGMRHLGLPIPRPDSGHPQPLLFDFLAASNGEAPLTGHANGVVTVALNEADDATREKIREDMGEPYRTLLGHFRHEIGHYYWDILVRDGDRVDAFRALFGDERADYAAALEAHYQNGAPADWSQSYVSSYATMHPWEDWAETWAHYMHITDTLETAATFGMSIDPTIEDDGDLTTTVTFNPFEVNDAGRLLSAWMPLSVALNALNRSMGQPDSYPFTLPDPVRTKLAFVHDLVRAGRQQDTCPR